LINLHVKPAIPAKLAALEELSYNLWSTWDKDAQILFGRIDPHLYRLCDHNPVKLLHEVLPERLAELAEDNGFLFELNEVHAKFQHYIHFAECEERGELPAENVIAYLSMEYGLHESIPAYSGGLGVLAGDYLKAASDRCMPMVAFGLLYKHGYFSQRINLDGMQEESYHIIDWHTKPVRLVRDADGGVLLNSVVIEGREVFFKTWRIDVGCVRLYLMDTDIDQNEGDLREITDILYDANRDKRIRQEIMLAMGSYRLMQSLNIEPVIYHLNEGHSAFLILERLHDLVKRGHTLPEAREIVTQSTVFTTHTPVVDGNEHFERHLVEYHLRGRVEETGLNFDEFFALGAIDGDAYNFWLPAFALRFSRYANAVSMLHAEVSRQMWRGLYPHLHEREVPIVGITNGVHLQSWLSGQMVALFDRYLGPDYLHRAEKETLWEKVRHIPDAEIWEAHRQRKEQMISFVRDRVEKGHKGRGQLYHSATRSRSILSPDFLTVGFARRFAPYKRADLILEDPARLLALLKHPQRPVQFVFAGKAHPADQKGKNLIRRLIAFARENGVEDRLVFIEDYDINIARHLVQGVDVWLNNPVRPMEASGTSGMKAGMNGILNLSVLDGWWPECWREDAQVGWAIHPGDHIADHAMRRRMEANQIYDLLENDVRDMYYDRDQSGAPQRWIAWMKNAVRLVGMGFNMHRMLRDYTQRFYIPGIDEIRRLLANDAEALKARLAAEQEIAAHWDAVSITGYSLGANLTNGLRSGDEIPVSAEVRLDGLRPNLCVVEVFYLFSPTEPPVQVALNLQKQEKGTARYQGAFRLRRTGFQEVGLRLRAVSPVAGGMMRQYVKWA